MSSGRYQVPPVKIEKVLIGDLFIIFAVVVVFELEQPLPAVLELLPGVRILNLAVL